MDIINKYTCHKIIFLIANLNLIIKYLLIKIIIYIYSLE